MANLTRSPQRRAFIYLGWLIAATVACLLPAAARAQCVGDCDGDGKVSISELIVGVNIVLGTQDPSVCTAFQNRNGTVDISQLVKGVNNAFGSCPMVPTPTSTAVNGPTTTSGPVGTPTDTPSPSGTPTSTGTAGPTGTATPCPLVAVCGDGCIEPGETCDDGNTMDGDNCPSTCVINTCQPSMTIVDVDVVLQLPADATLGAIDVFLRYPDTAVVLPGSGNAAAPDIINLPDDAFPPPTVNDLDYGVILIAEGPGGLTLGDAPRNRLFTAEFKLCKEASVPAASDFHCTVNSAALVDGTDIGSATTCSVAVVTAVAATTDHP